MVLVIGAGLMVRGFQSLIQAGAQFDPGRMLTIRVSLNPVRYRTPVQQAAFFRQAIERAGTLPGVRSAFVISAMPFSRTSDSAPFWVEGRQMKPDSVQIRAVSADYFRALHIGLLRGSLEFDAPNTAVISRSAARRWKVEPGQRVQMKPPDGPWLTIAGVADDIQQSVLSRDPTPVVYVAYDRFPRREMDIALRTAGPAITLGTAARALIHALDPEQVITQIGTLAEMIYQEAFVFAYMAALMGVFGLIALTLSAIGIYGVMAYVVSQQQHEIGVRMALGATRSSVMRLLLRRGLRTALAGLLLGLAPSYALARLLRTAVFGVNLQDPALFTVIPLVLLAAAGLSVYIPARRGAQTDPMVALRE